MRLLFFRRNGYKYQQRMSGECGIEKYSVCIGDTYCHAPHNFPGERKLHLFPYWLAFRAFLLFTSNRYYAKLISPPVAGYKMVLCGVTSRKSLAKCSFFGGFRRLYKRAITRVIPRSQPAQECVPP